MKFWQWLYIALCVLIFYWAFGVLYRNIFIDDVVAPQRIQSSAPSVSPTTYPVVSIESIFSSNHQWVDEVPNDKKIIMITTGDVLPARSVNYKMTQMQNFRWPFEQTADLLRQGDVTVINLETPLFDGCKPTTEGMIFCGDAKAVEGLVFAGIDVVNLANNHTENYGRLGLQATKELMEKNNIEWVLDNVVTMDIKGIKFSFLAYNDIGNVVDMMRVQSDLATIGDNVAVVSFHWGEEYTSTPSARQVELAHAAIDAGADIVLGNHPHWIQPVEVYKEKMIIYAQGNFIFDQEWSMETKIGVVGRYTFVDKKLVDVEYIPIGIRDYGQAYIPESAVSKTILELMKNLSEQLL